MNTQLSAESQNTANQTDSSNSYSREVLYKTPFTSIQTPEGWFMAMGNQRVSETFTDYADYEDNITPIVTMNWEILTPVIATIVNQVLIELNVTK